MTDATLRRERSTLTGFADNRLDRREDLRNNSDAVTALRHRSDTRITVVAGETPVLNRTGEDSLSIWFSHGQTEMIGPALEEIFLGMAEDGSPRFGRLIDRALIEPLTARPELLLTDLRSIALKGLVPTGEVGPLGEAKAVLDWHARHRFCAQCGGPTVAGASGWRRECTSCGAMHFPRTDPVVIMLASRGSRRGCIPASRASSSPARRSRTRSDARAGKRPACASARCAISPPSPGLSLPRSWSAASPRRSATRSRST
jgi:NAD+ diphosphatase